MSERTTENDAGGGREGAAWPAGVRPDRETRFPLPLLLLLLGIAALHTATMPKSSYPGDNVAIRMETANLLNTGQLGIPYSRREEIRDSVENRGQFFFENDTSRRYFSKFGIGYTVLYLPPLLAEKLYSGRLDLRSNSPSQFMFLNIYGILLTLIVTVYLYKIVALYTTRTWLRLAFVGLSYYTTFLWHYLRAPTTEIIHLAPFVAFYFHATMYIRSTRSKAGGPARGWRHLTVATCLVGLLALIKASFVLLFVPLWLAAFLSGPATVSMARRGWHNLRANGRRYALCLILPSAVGVAALFATNYWRCGSPFETGYGQWISKRTAMTATYLSLRNFPTAFHGLVLDPGNGNVLIHYPLLVFAAFGLPRFIRKHAVDSAFLGLVFLTLFGAICLLSSWCGTWCYGPRLVIHALMIGSIPFVETIQFLIERAKEAWSVSVMVAMGIVLSYSLLLQVHMNSLHYFAFYHACDFFDRTARQIADQAMAMTPPGAKKALRAHHAACQDRVRDYFQSSVHRGLIHGDLIAYRDSDRIFPPLEALTDMVPPPLRARVLDQIRPVLQKLAASDFHFLE